jgi:hypothetical protein
MEDILSDIDPNLQAKIEHDYRDKRLDVNTKFWPDGSNDYSFCN